MHRQFSYIRSLNSSFSQTNFNKIASLTTYLDTTIFKVDRLVDNVDKLISTSDLERIRLKKHKIEDSSYIPYIDTLVV